MNVRNIMNEEQTKAIICRRDAEKSERLCNHENIVISRNMGHSITYESRQRVEMISWLCYLLAVCV